MPILSICGGTDTAVPVVGNAQVLAERYRDLDGPITLVCKPHNDHHQYWRGIWQHGVPSAASRRVYSDLLVQIYDWGNDGVNEVLYVRQARYAEPHGYEHGDFRVRECIGIPYTLR